MLPHVVLHHVAVCFYMLIDITQRDTCQDIYSWSSPGISSVIVAFRRIAAFRPRRWRSYLWAHVFDVLAFTAYNYVVIQERCRQP